MMTRIVDFLKKYKWICLGVLAAAVVLTVAFISGGSLNPPDASFVTQPDVTVTAAVSNTDAAATAAVSAAQPTQGAASQGTTAPRTSAATTAPATTSAPTNSSAVIVRTGQARGAYLHVFRFLRVRAGAKGTAQRGGSGGDSLRRRDITDGNGHV